MACEIVELNGCPLWADVGESDEGLRLRLSLDEWRHLGLAEGGQVCAQRDGKPDALLVVGHVTERSPVVLIVLERRLWSRDNPPARTPPSSWSFTSPSSSTPQTCAALVVLKVRQTAESLESRLAVALPFRSPGRVLAALGEPDPAFPHVCWALDSPARRLGGVVSPRLTAGVFRARRGTSAITLRLWPQFSCLRPNSPSFSRTDHESVVQKAMRRLTRASARVNIRATSLTAACRW